jgi:hypothetical protein
MAIKSKLILYLMCIGGVGNLFGYTWPSEDAVVVENFGQRSGYGQGVQRGLRMRTQSQEIQSIEQGEVLFSQYADSQLPSRSQGNIVVGHADQLYSIYTNVVGMAKEQEGGQSRQQHFLLEQRAMQYYEMYVYDSRVRQYINPRVFLPAKNSDRAVVIEQVMMEDQQGRSYVLYNGAVVPSMEVAFYVATYVVSDEGLRLAPSSVSLQILGNTVATIELNGMMEDKGRSYLLSAQPLLLDDLYSQRGMLYLAKTQLLEGQLNMVLRVTTLDGQVQESSMRIRVVG